MNRILSVFFVLVSMLAVPTHGQAQIKELAKELLNADQLLQEKPAVDTVKLKIDSLRAADSIRIVRLQQQVQELSMRELELEMQLDHTLKSSVRADSLKRARQAARIDSLRATSIGSPVVVDGDTLLVLYASVQGLSLNERTRYIEDRVNELGEKRSVRPDSVLVVKTEAGMDIMYRNQLIMVVTENDALWVSTPRDTLAMQYRTAIVGGLHKLQKKNSILEKAKHVGLFLLIIGAQYMLFRLTNWLYRKLRRRVIRLSHTKLKPISFKSYEFLDNRRQTHILVFFANIIRYIALLMQLVISVPLLFSIFPQTKHLAVSILAYIIAPVKSVLSQIVNYLPNIFYIIVIWAVIQYLLKGVKFMANEIKTQKLRINGFYPDWAEPTYNIVRFLMYAFMIAMIYPYLPGSGSGVFQGISVFVGLIVSLGSTAVIGNILAGLIITYMRPFKMGDRVKLGETIGNVIEKTSFVTRIKTPKNEIITIPNSFVMSAQTVNYSSSARNFGLIIHTSITMGYEVPWRTVHTLLIEAALNTPGVLKDPTPFVLELGFGDYYPTYQINAHIKDVAQITQIQSRLHQSIQDVFDKAGLDLAAPMQVMHK